MEKEFTMSKKIYSIFSHHLKTYYRLSNKTVIELLFRLDYICQTVKKLKI